METYLLTVSSPYKAYRLDKYMSQELPNLSRTRIQRLIEEGQVTVNTQVVQDSSYKIKEGEVIYVEIPPAIEALPCPQDIPLEILYEDEHLMVLNKPAGLVVHPAPGHRDETLVNALLAHCGDSLSGIGGVRRPGIVHRLDKDTTGLMVIAKNDAAHQGLSSQFSDRSLSRTYHALIWGVPKLSQGTINLPLGRCPRHRQKIAIVQGGKTAITHYRVLATAGTSADLRHHISLVECKLETGRTHQIRVHLTQLGHPLLGDLLYGYSPKGVSKYWPREVTLFNRQALHAKELHFIHPHTNKSCQFTSPYPDDFLNLMTVLKFNYRL